MRTAEIKIFRITELSESAQEHAHFKYLSNHFSYNEEISDTLKAFAKIFPIKIKNWSYDSQSANVSWEFEHFVSEDVQELSGIRLSAFLWNNYGKDLFKLKYKGALKKNYPVKHKRIEHTDHKNGNHSIHYYSAISFSTDCVLTGMCFDYDILEPIYKFLKKPDSGVDFEYLMQDCISSWEVAAKNEAENETSLEYFKDIAEANDYEFTENGERF